MTDVTLGWLKMPPLSPQATNVPSWRTARLQQATGDVQTETRPVVVGGKDWLNQLA